MAAVVAAAALSAPVAQADTLKIAIIETLSGMLAPTGENLVRSYQTLAQMAREQNWTGAGHTFEATGFDNKGSPKEAVAQLQAAISQGYHFVAQGNGSHITAALVDAIEKHNASHPGKEVLMLNHSAVDPALTNQKCSFWHFRFDPHSDMKMQALVDFIAADPKVRKVYLIGQNYTHGQQVSQSAKAMLKSRRPDIEIVGDELHPIAQIQDFSPHAARIKASGADAVITGNWDSDLALLIKAARQADLKARFFTYYAGMSSGVPAVMGAGEVGQVVQVGNWHANIENFPGKVVQETYRQQYKEDFYAAPVFTIFSMLSKAIRQTGSTDTVKIAFALEGMTVPSLSTSDSTMRAADHQVQGTQYISSWVKRDGQAIRYDEAGTGYGWKTERRVTPQMVEQPTTCQMTRPAR